MITDAKWKSLSPLQKQKLLVRLKRENAKRDPMPFREWSYNYMGDYFDLSPSAMHEFLWDRIDRLHYQQDERVSLIAPRGGGKTSIGTKANATRAIVQEAASYIMLISDTFQQSQQNLSAIKEQLTENESLATDYPWACGEGPVWSETRIVTKNGILVEALGTGAKIRGRTRGKNRPDLIICDDLENDELVESPEGRRKRKWWFNRALLPAVARGGNVMVIGTALHPDDLIQNLKKSPGWEHHLFRSIVNEPDRQDLWKEFRELLSRPTPDKETKQKNESDARALYRHHRNVMDAGAELLWPESESLLDLMILRTVIGEPAFQSEKQGNPVSSKTSEFADELFRGDLWFHRWPGLQQRVMYVDPSKGKTEKSDYSAITCLGQAASGYFYAECDLERRDVVKICEAIIDTYLRFKPSAVGVEENGFVALGELLLRMAAERSVSIPLFKVNNTVGKRVRVRQYLTPPLRNKILRFHSGSRGTELAVEQLREFPTSQHDDGPDSLAGAFYMMEQIGFMGPVDVAVEGVAV